MSPLYHFKPSLIVYGNGTQKILIGINTKNLALIGKHLEKLQVSRPH
jgi:hypothetical protein